MPLYEYHCKKCDHSFEFLVRLSEPPTCPQCGASGQDLEKLLSAPVAHSKSNSQPAPKACPMASGPSCSSCPMGS
ncbi:MAG: zinc ribbon domain-containing protein [Thermoguttaceae bacterium]|nr:zinc ribbon domain-containing protein [Thermoguttaceae bacterium]MDW8078510.1 zinc ribbon domain-containing protein [Thermoguttaceae bacterium]